MPKKILTKEEEIKLGINLIFAPLFVLWLILLINYPIDTLIFTGIILGSVSLVVGLTLVGILE